MNQLPRCQRASRGSQAFHNHHNIQTTAPWLISIARPSLIKRDDKQFTMTCTGASSGNLVSSNRYSSIWNSDNTSCLVLWYCAEILSTNMHYPPDQTHRQCLQHISSLATIQHNEEMTNKVKPVTQRSSKNARHKPRISIPFVSRYSRCYEYTSGTDQAAMQLDQSKTWLSMASHRLVGLLNLFSFIRTGQTLL